MNNDGVEIVHAPAGGSVSVLGFCSSHSGKAGCVGERRVTRYELKGRIYWFCGICFPHRKRIAKQLDAQSRR